MNEKMDIRKIGKFYNVFGDDCYLLYYLFDYKIKQNRTGFPSRAYNKVINKLEEQMIDYEIIGEGIKVSFKKKNNYNKYVRRVSKLILNLWQFFLFFNEIIFGTHTWQVLKFEYNVIWVDYIHIIS